MLSEEDLAAKEGLYENVDGRRFEDGRYKAFMDVSDRISSSSAKCTKYIRNYVFVLLCLSVTY
eukprot:scaffold349076_cov48-Prasinocladus_malaysianus.AAC.1